MTENSYTLLWYLTAMGRNAFVVWALRYLLMALPSFALGYLLFRRALLPRRLDSRTPSARQLLRELGLSLSSSVVFAGIEVGVVSLSLAGVMRLRILEPAPGALTIVLSVLVLVALHDAYFYWSHRFLHWGPMFRTIHHAHHRSTHPTPLAAFAFHPVEAAIQYAFVPLVALVAPLHVVTLLVFGMVMSALNVYGHGGIELSPRAFVHTGIGRYLLTPTHHGLHHSSIVYNYGFYSNVWDRMMGTNHPGYERVFDEVCERPEPAVVHDAQQEQHRGT